MKISLARRKLFSPARLQVFPDPSLSLQLSHPDPLFRASPRRILKELKPYPHTKIISPLLSDTPFTPHLPLNLSERRNTFRAPRKIAAKNSNETVHFDAVNDLESSSRPPARQKTPTRALGLEVNGKTPSYSGIQIESRRFNSTSKASENDSSLLKVGKRNRLMRKEYTKSSYSHRERKAYGSNATPDPSRVNHQMYDIGRALERVKHIKFELKNITEQPKSVSRIPFFKLDA
jgi:hypothetical protein